MIRFQHKGWESSYRVPYTEDIIAFVYQHLNEAILNFDESSLETTHKEDNSVSLESNSNSENKKVTRKTSTKPIDTFDTEQSNSDDASSDTSGTNNNDDDTNQKKKKKDRLNEGSFVTSQ